MPEVSPDIARFQPSTHDKDVEQVLALHTVKRAIYVAPVLALIMGLTRGVDGAIAALIAVAIIAVNFLLSGALMSRSARISLSFYHAAALFGFFLRLGFIMVSMYAVSRLAEIDETALGISVVVAYLTLLTWEAVAVSKGAERELEWTS